MAARELTELDTLAVEERDVRVVGFALNERHVALFETLADELGEVDIMYLTDAEADDFGPLRLASVFQDGGLSDAQTQRAWEIVSSYRQRFAEDVRTISPTLTRERVEELLAVELDKLTAEETRELMVAGELAEARGGPGVKPKNIARVLYGRVPIPVTCVAPRRSGRRAPRSRRVVRRARSRSPGRPDPPEPEPPPLADGRRRW